MKLSNLKINQMQNVNNAVNPALTDIKVCILLSPYNNYLIIKNECSFVYFLVNQNAIAAAKQEGRDADYCYEPARQQLGDASKTAFNALDKCVDDQLATLRPVKLNIESHLSVSSQKYSFINKFLSQMN